MAKGGLHKRPGNPGERYFGAPRPARVRLASELTGIDVHKPRGNRALRELACEARRARRRVSNRHRELKHEGVFGSGGWNKQIRSVALDSKRDASGRSSDHYPQLQQSFHVDNPPKARLRLGIGRVRG